MFVRRLALTPTAPWHPPKGLGSTQSALTIGNFDGVHLGHQAILDHLRKIGQARGLCTAAMTFEPHPRDYFALATSQPDTAPARILTLRDKLSRLQSAGLDMCALLRFNKATATLTAEQFIEDLLVKQLRVKYLLVGDDFRFGAQRRGDFSMLVQAGAHWGFEVEQVQSVEVRGQRVSSSLVRQALQNSDLAEAGALMGQPYSVSGHVIHGRKLGRELGFRTLNLRFAHNKPACSGIFVVQVHGLVEGHALQGVANFGVRPSLDPSDVNGGRVLLETHVLDWPAHFGANHAYGKIISVDLLQKLHDELRYDSLDALIKGIEKDCLDARAFFLAHPAQTRRQTTRDRI
jgi:riboflavin kinase/FMN adenylyltransferase